MKWTLLLLLMSSNVFSIMIDRSERKNQNQRAFNFNLKSISSELNNDLAKFIPKKLNYYKNEIIREDQYYKGIKVYGSQMIYHIKNNKLVYKTGKIADLNDNNIDTSIYIDYLEALEIVESKYSNFKLKEAELVILPTKKTSKLAWHFKEISNKSKREIFISANTGEVLFSFNNLHTLYSEVYDMSIFKNDFQWGYAKLPGDHAIDISETSNEEAIYVHNISQGFLNILKKDFGRNSYDDQGTTLVSSIHFGNKYNNAFWNGIQIVLGDGDGVMLSNLTRSIDIIAHEISHGITTSTSDLIYRGESGALNEAFSDIMGAYSEYKLDSDNSNWLLGEVAWTPNIEGDALRYMNNPTADKEQSIADGYPDLYSRDSYAQRYTGEADQGGVHINSGIANLAFYLLVEGGKHPRIKNKIKVKKLGMEKTIQIFFKAFTENLVKSSSFSDLKRETMKVALNLYGKKARKAVKSAWEAVEVL